MSGIPNISKWALDVINPSVDSSVQRLDYLFWETLLDNSSSDHALLIKTFNLSVAVLEALKGLKPSELHRVASKTYLSFEPSKQSVENLSSFDFDAKDDLFWVNEKFTHLKEIYLQTLQYVAMTHGAEYATIVFGLPSESIIKIKNIDTPSISRVASVNVSWVLKCSPRLIVNRINGCTDDVRVSSRPFQLNKYAQSLV